MSGRYGSTDFPHRAFIEALAEAPDTSPAWHTIVAGYASLQLFEGWADLGAAAMAPNTIELRRVRKYIESIADTRPIRRCLGQFVDSIEVAANAPITARAELAKAVGNLLRSYAKLLQYDGDWALAADVHRSCIQYAHLLDDADGLLDSMLMRGFSLRMQGLLDDASDAYATLRAAATLARSERYRLESFLSDAKIAVDRGNFPVARELLDRTIADARRANCAIVVAKGLTDRARIAAMDGEYELSLACSYEALERSVDQMDRERILGNIAVCFAQLGLRDAARDAGLLVVATAQDRSARLTAIVNLMELAYLDGRELVFEQYRRELGREELTPYLHAVYLETAAAGLRAFGRETEALNAARRMLDVAERYDLHEFVIKAELLLSTDHSSLRQARAEASQHRVEATGKVATIVQAIADMRLAAGLP